MAITSKALASCTEGDLVRVLKRNGHPLFELTDDLLRVCPADGAPDLAVVDGVTARPDGSFKFPRELLPAVARWLLCSATIAPTGVERGSTLPSERMRNWQKNPNNVPIVVDAEGDTRTYEEQYIDEFIRYYELAMYNNSRTIPIRAHPASPDGKSGKNPIEGHRDVDYDAKCAEHVSDMRRRRAWWAYEILAKRWRLNLLLDDLYVIDLDGPTAVNFFERELRPRFQDEFASCPLQKTSKGFHYIFVRPRRCTHVYKSPGYQQLDGTKLPMDCITVTGSANSRGQFTRGCLSVFPSAGKMWIRSIHDYPPKVMSDGLYALMDRHYIHGGAKRRLDAPSTSRAAEPRKAMGQVDARAHKWTDFIAREANCSKSCVTWTPGVFGTDGRVVAAHRRCLADPKHVAEHDNALLRICLDGSLLYRCMSARCKKTVKVPWASASAAEYASGSEG